MASSNATDDFDRIVARVRDADAAERVAAHAYAAGAVGLEEREGDGDIVLILYTPRALAEPVADALREAFPEIASIEPPAPVPRADWGEDWKRGLGRVTVSPRLVVRPSFVGSALAAGQHELVIDPGQAFGTGGHESTRLAIEWVDALVDALPAGARVLDVGTGTGVLSLAVLRLSSGEPSVFGFDLDPLAAEAARVAARENGLEPRLHLFTGPLAALDAAARFDLVLANLLRSELEPLLADIASRTRPGGRVVIAGVLESDESDLVAQARPMGLVLEAVRHRDDASGARWSSLLMERRSERASD